MGELDLVNVCGAFDPASEGYILAIRTVLVAWAPLVVAGIAIGQSQVVHATMRGAGLMRLLARVAITILIAGIAMALLIAALATSEFSRSDTLSDAFVLVSVSLGVGATVVGLGVAGLLAWHRVLVTLASREGEGRLLV